MNENKNNIIIFTVIALILGGIAGFYYGNLSGKEQGFNAGVVKGKADMEILQKEKEKKEAEEIAKKAAEGAVNPFSEVKTNPFEEVNTNPYKGVKTNPFAD